MSENVSAEALSERQRLWLRFAWVRWVLGVVAAVVATLIIVSTTISQNLYDGCQRSSSERLNTAKKDAQDAVREDILADHGVTATERNAHAESSGAAAAAALNIAQLAGYDVPGDTIRQQLNNLRVLNVKSAEVQKSNESFCHKQYPKPLPFVG